VDSTKRSASFIDPASDPRWDRFVEAHPNGLICHLSGWKQVLEASFPHMKGYYPVLLDASGGQIVAGLPVFQVRSWLTGNRLVSIPFATLCDPLVTTKDEMAQLLRTALDLYRRSSSSYVEVRTLKASSLVEGCGLSKVSFFKNHCLNLAPGADEVFKSFHKNSIKAMIARAVKSGVSLRIGDNEHDLKEFYRLHSLTRKRLGLPCHPYRFLQLLWRQFHPAGKLSLLLAKKDRAHVAGIILLKFKGRVAFEFGASDDAHFNIGANQFLLWKAIEQAIEEGYKLFDFGRTSPSNDGLMTFKKRWGTEVRDIPHFYFPLDKTQTPQNEGSLGYRMMHKLCEITPRNMQKVIGEFCYRHLG